MRKFVLVMFVAFTASVFAFSSVAQRRGRGRGRATASRPADAPQSPRIAQELGGIQWGWTHDQVVDYFRRAITARYQPQLRNKGQVEQDRLMQQRDEEINSIRQSYIQLNGQVNQRRWDTSFVGQEYTHGNNESLLVHEDPSTGNREFFFFFNDRLWKRFQARALPRGARLEFGTFVSGLEQLFGNGLHVNSPDAPDRLDRVEWQDANTHLRVSDQSTFFNVFCLVYEEKATLTRLAELRRNAPTKTASASARVAADQPQVGNVEGDNNEDIVDRITGKMRRVQSAQGAPNAGRTGAPTGTGTTGTTGAPSGGTQTPTPPPQGGSSDDPLRGL